MFNTHNLQRQSTSAPFTVTAATKAGMHKMWHHHPYYELIYVNNCSGVRFVGDNISKYLPGDLVLLGRNLPHAWSACPIQKDPLQEQDIKMVSVAFSCDFFQEEVFNMPEFNMINVLFDQCRLGMSFESDEAIGHSMVDLCHKRGTERLLLLLSVLDKLSRKLPKHTVSSSDMTQVLFDKSERMNKVIHYISTNYTANLSLETMSLLIGMSPNAFCRYFKRITSKSYSQFVNEVRIQNAMRLMASDDKSIRNISFEVGYKSLTNFNRQFKKLIDSTPMQYRQSLRS